MTHVTIHVLNESETHSYMDALTMTEKGKKVFCNSDESHNIEVMKLEYELHNVKQLGESVLGILSESKDRESPIKPVFVMAEASNGAVALYWRNIVNELSDGSGIMQYHKFIESLLFRYEPQIELYSNSTVKSISLKIKGKHTLMKNLNENQFI